MRKANINKWCKWNAHWYGHDVLTCAVAKF